MHTILENLGARQSNAAKLFREPHTNLTYVAARFFAAHRRFIRSDNFLRPASVSMLADWYKR